MVVSTGSGAASVGDRGLIEDAVKLLLSGVPTGWACVRGEFEPSSQPAVALASVSTADGEFAPLAVSAEVLGVLAEHQRRAAAGGVSWRRLVIECHVDGRLSARTDRDERVAGSPPVADRRWLRRGLAAVTAGCLIAAAVVFALGWRASLPPRAGMIPVPPPPPRQQEAFNVISRWFDAENHSDAAGMRALTCANPGSALVDRTKTIQSYGEFQAFFYPDAVVSFSANGPQFNVRVASQLHPINERMKQFSQLLEKNGGFTWDDFVLVDEGGQLKVCDINGEDQ
jgi:hypothetical protein